MTRIDEVGQGGGIGRRTDLVILSKDEMRNGGRTKVK